MSNALIPLQNSELQSYSSLLNHAPLLSQAEEQALARAYQEEGDLEAAKKLVLSHLRYVARIAHQYKGYGLSVADLMQEGAIGLMKAVQRFDPNKGVRLVSFAVHWIKSEIHEFVIKNWRIVKTATTKAQRKLFFNLRSQKQRLGWMTSQEVNAVANDLGVKPEEVLEMEKRLNAQDEHFDAPDDLTDDTLCLAPSQRLAAPATTEPEMIHTAPDWGQRREFLAEALTKLDARSRHIIEQRYLAAPKASLKVLAEQYDISLERVRQLEKAAIAQLTELVTQS